MGSKRRLTADEKVKSNTRRMCRWRHNSMIGYVAMAQTQMQVIADAPSVTKEARMLALQIGVCLTTWINIFVCVLIRFSRQKENT